MIDAMQEIAKIMAGIGTAPGEGPLTGSAARASYSASPRRPDGTADFSGKRLAPVAADHAGIGAIAVEARSAGARHDG